MYKLPCTIPRWKNIPKQPLTLSWIPTPLLGVETSGYASLCVDLGYIQVWKKKKKPKHTQASQEFNKCDGFGACDLRPYSRELLAVTSDDCCSPAPGRFLCLIFCCLVASAYLCGFINLYCEQPVSIFPPRLSVFYLRITTNNISSSPTFSVHHDFWLKGMKFWDLKWHQSSEQSL